LLILSISTKRFGTFVRIKNKSMDIHRLYDKYIYIGAYVNAGPKVDWLFRLFLFPPFLDT